ncbi:hypothetical protein O1611_g6408 [Lasiodiplodia mahajangana]|uniref:Uncharacterized protein n=1 Tax=Lasiodiplodia mahajangana TaxID=1108764 RepID=A0ACC2JJ33_9PEZI|nr:hypothetical protein O1611_g6408 [Lasiodiplodia mahajangana]
MPRVFRHIISRLKSKDKDQGDADEGPGTESMSNPASSDIIGPLDFPDDCEGSTDGFDLIFVHGLRGSRLKTWTRNDVFWPRDLLKDDLRNVRVITWGYDANIANAFTYASEESLFGHATTLLNDIARLRRGITRPIIFICHSLGGLVVKQALITSDSYKAHGRHPSLGEIYNDTVGVIFMGTPHRGSSKETYGEIAAKVAKLSLRRPNDQLLQTLRPDSHLLEKQRDDFTTISNNMAIVCIREELPTAVGLVVPETSASYDGFNVARGAIHANHMDMVKFSERTEGYKRTLGYIQGIIDEKSLKVQQGMDYVFVKSASTCDVQFSPIFTPSLWFSPPSLRLRTAKSKAIEARKDEILDALRFPGIDDRKNGIDAAYGETCSWVWGNQPTDDGLLAAPCEFISWLRSTEPFLWVSGKAGCGKSTLMKYIYQNPKTRVELEHSPWTGGKDLVLLGYFFHDRGSDNQKSREGMLRSILVQILVKQRDLIPVVFARRFFDDSYSGDFKSQPQILNEFLSWQNLSEIFISILQFLRSFKICLFLDGLDEYRMAGRETQYTEEELDLVYDGNNEDEAWGRSKWITEGHKEVARFIHKLKVFENVKVCMSSRELVMFEHEFWSLPRIAVHAHTTGAIAQYCKERLTQEAPDINGLSEFVSAITNKCFGVFLWVRLVVDMLVDGYANGDYTAELWATLEMLPSRLGGKNGLYMHMMRSIESRYLPETKRLFQLVTRWGDICSDICSHHPDILTLFLAQEGHFQDDTTEHLRVTSDDYDLRTWSGWESRWTNLQKRLKSRCGGLLEGTKGVQFMHQTAKQFISRKYLWEEMYPGASGFTSEINIDLALASGLIRRLKCCAEAVIIHDQTGLGRLLHEQPNRSRYKEFTSTTGDYDPYLGAASSEAARDIFLPIFSVVTRLDGSDLMNKPYPCTRLLDELDHVGKRLTHTFRAAKNLPDSTWPGAYAILKPNTFNIRVMLNFLDFMLSNSMGYYYMEEKLKSRKFSRQELSYLLQRAALYCGMRWRTADNQVTYFRLSPRIVRVLLQEGADPNSCDILSSLGMSSRKGSTIWTTYLDQLGDAQLAPQLDTVQLVTKAFLEHGADPEARWDRLGGHGIDTPESVLTRSKNSTSGNLTIRPVMRFTEENAPRELVHLGDRYPA